MAVTGGSGITEARPDIAESISASLSTVSASPGSVATGVNSTITITVKDVDANPVPGVGVTLSATGTGNTIVQPSPTNASGVTTGTISSTVPAAKVVSAVAGGVPITQTATVTVVVGPVSAAQSTVVADPTSVELGGALSTITVTVKDAYDNPISGATVVLAATGTGNTLTQPGSVTNASGVATGTLSSTVVESKTVSATANGTGITQTATVTVTSPIPMTGLEGWWKADAITGLVDADPIGTWMDVSGNGRSATQGTASQKPTYRTSVVNGKPVVRFDGVDDVLSHLAMPDFGDAYTVLVVSRTAAGSTGGYVFDLATGVQLAGFGLTTLDNQEIWRGTDSVGLQQAQYVADLRGAFHCRAGINAGTQLAYFVDGVSRATAAYTAPNPSTLDRIAIGQTTQAGSSFNGDIAELIIYNRALSDAEREQVEDYLMAKFGL
jgi:hypothetical protein